MNLKLDDKLEYAMKLAIQLKAELNILSNNKDGFFEDQSVCLKKVNEINDSLSNIMIQLSELIGSNIFDNALDEACKSATTPST